MSPREHFGCLSPPPNYQHSPSASAPPFSSFQFTLAPAKSQSTPLQNPYPQQHGPRADQTDEHYLAKYKDMKRKVEELELDNDRLHLKCLTIRKNIQRLRLERAILHERLQAMDPRSNGHSMSQNDLAHATTRQSNPDPSQEKQPQLCPSSINHYVSIAQATTSSPAQTSPTIPFLLPREPVAVPCSSATLINKLGPNQIVTATDTMDMSGGPTIISPPLHHVRNGGSLIKTFPFVHEYPTIQDKNPHRVTAIHQEHPMEIKFHQYEAGAPDQRTRREADEKGNGRQRRRAPRDLDKPQQSSAKRHVTTFRNQFTYSFQSHPTSPADTPGYDLAS